MKRIEGYTVEYLSKNHGWIAPLFCETYGKALIALEDYESRGYQARIKRDHDYQF